MKNYLWVIEYKSPGSVWKWDSTCETRRMGRVFLKNHKEIFSDEQFRLVKYVRLSTWA